MSSLIIAFVSQWLVQFPLAFFLSRHTDLHAVGSWWSFPITNIVASIVSISWFAQGGWRKSRLSEDDRDLIRDTDNGVRL